MVNVYDSLYNDVISHEIEEQANDFLGGGLISLDCTYQYKSKLMVVTAEFSIAFAICLAFVVDPSHVTFGFSKMRSHLQDCLKCGKITCFQFSGMFNY